MDSLQLNYARETILIILTQATLYNFFVLLRIQSANCIDFQVKLRLDSCSGGTTKKSLQPTGKFFPLNLSFFLSF